MNTAAAKSLEIDSLAKNIQKLLLELENIFWDLSVSPPDAASYSKYEQYARDDQETWLFHGTRQLYYKICLFLEMKEALHYLQMFRAKFGDMIDDEELVTKSRGPLYDNAEPSIIIHDDFRDFLSAFREFDNVIWNKHEVNKLKLVLENTSGILSKTQAIITNETSIYTPVRWFLEIIYPSTVHATVPRFIKKLKTYRPDILIPEISSAVEYKYIRTTSNAGTYLDEIKTDADNYTGDPDYKFFYAVVYFEDKASLNQAAFKAAVDEKAFPEHWTIMAV